MPESADRRNRLILSLLLVWPASAPAADWPQYRGPTTDGVSSEAISTSWPQGGLRIVWTNASVTNGFSSFAVSQERAFVLCSRDDGFGNLLEYCVALSTASGSELWATPIGEAPWDPTVAYNGGDGAYPSYNTGDGPRTTPSVKGGRVIALSGLLHLVCLNTTNGSVLWSNNLVSSFGASTLPWENAASPRLDGDLVFVNLNTSADGRTLAAFRTADGNLAWSSQNENATHSTPVVTTIAGVRQVVFATRTGLVSLDPVNGSRLWKFTYPFPAIGTSMGASPVVYSNIVYCTADYNGGAAAARITLSNGVWAAQQLYYKQGRNYRSIWMTPVCHQGYIFTLCGDNSTFLTTPLNCIDLLTGDLKWETNNFGMGGLILVNTNLLVLTEDGQLVLVQPNPAAYIEGARYRAFQFSQSAPGKCWNSPAYSNGRIYARSTRMAVCLDASVPEPPAPLQVLAPKVLTSTQVQLEIKTADGSPIDSNRLAKVQVLASESLETPTSLWPALTNPLVPTPEGQARLTNTSGGGQPRQFFRAVERP